MTETTSSRGRLLRGTELRYALVRLLQLIGPATVPELAEGLRIWGFTVNGRPSKAIPDALRWERRRDRVRRIGRGRYRAGAMPRSTEHRIIRRVAELRAEAVSLIGGHNEHVSAGGAGCDGPAATSPAWP